MAIPFVLAMFLVRSIIPYILLITYKRRLFDRLDDRKVHQSFTPRLGGVAFMPVQIIVLAFSLVIIYGFDFQDYLPVLITWRILPMFVMWAVGMCMLYLVGIADDILGVSYKVKFLVQLLAASLFPIAGLWINDLYGFFFVVQVPYFLGAILTVFLTVFIINAINLIDGLDGLCAGLIGVSSVVMGILFMLGGAWVHALLAFITAGVLIPFFIYNVFGVVKKRRRIFMGDTGSMTLGYTAAFLAISYSMNLKEIKPFAEGAIIVAFSTLLIPIYDVLRVITIRLYARRPIFKADRCHLHHRLLQLGFTHRQAMVLLIGVSLFLSVLNLLLVEKISNNIVVLLDIIVLLTLSVLFDIRLGARKTIVN